MPDGATTHIIKGAYPDRAQARVGALEKSMRADERLVAKAQAHLANVTKAAEAHLAYCEAELVDSTARYEKACEGFTPEKVAHIVRAREARQANADKLAAGLRAVHAEAKREADIQAAQEAAEAEAEG